MKQHQIQEYYTTYETIDELSQADKQLLEQAKMAAATAYAPYSGYRVGAALLSLSGMRSTGSNQENASFPVGMCAERVALAAHVSVHPADTILTLAIYVDNHPEQEPAAPCGMCRQMLFEQELRQSAPIRLLLQGNGHTVIEINSVKTLLPLAFSARDLYRQHHL